MAVGTNWSHNMITILNHVITDFLMRTFRGYRRNRDRKSEALSSFRGSRWRASLSDFLATPRATQGPITESRELIEHWENRHRSYLGSCRKVLVLLAILAVRAAYLMMMIILSIELRRRHRNVGPLPLPGPEVHGNCPCSIVVHRRAGVPN